jgi:hypothetical protein
MGESFLEDSMPIVAWKWVVSIRHINGLMSNMVLLACSNVPGKIPQGKIVAFLLWGMASAKLVGFPFDLLAMYTIIPIQYIRMDIFVFINVDIMVCLSKKEDVLVCVNL